MLSKKKKDQLPKTLVEKILDKQKISYTQFAFPTHEEHHVAQMQVEHLGIDEHLIYKTLVLTGKQTGPIVGVVPIDGHLDEKKLSQISGNKKIAMLPLKDLVATTGYEHGANTPIGIWEKAHFPIYIDQQAAEEPLIFVSSGKIGRSIQINPQDLQKAVSATFCDISTH
ncbi:Cys-tRNA(Pro) deacylase [Latilactobacillus fuchuensis]|nr:Cys-tRNA(Pro) deacylase [Latilactobacillus fuchuensis]